VAPVLLPDPLPTRPPAPGWALPPESAEPRSWSGVPVDSSAWIRTRDLTIMSRVPPCERRISVVTPGRGIPARRRTQHPSSRRAAPLVFALVDPWWTLRDAPRRSCAGTERARRKVVRRLADPRHDGDAVRACGWSLARVTAWRPLASQTDVRSAANATSETSTIERYTSGNSEYQGVPIAARLKESPGVSADGWRA